jgi:hypothetical protein
MTMFDIIVLVAIAIGICYALRRLDRWHTKVWEDSVWYGYGNGPRPPEVK